MKIERGSGIIMHITSLPGKYGIGTFGKESYEFVDFLQKCGQKYWQILPLGPTGYGDSPYQCVSAFAGNPYFISFEVLEQDNLLKEEDYVDVNFGDNEESVDYGAMFVEKMKVLKVAFKNFIENNYSKNEEYKRFKDEEKEWLEDYSLFMALKYNLQFASWNTWSEGYKLRKEESLEKYKVDHDEDIEYWNFLQYEFFKQYKDLKNYANNKGIKIIGDIPIYAAFDSVDVWSNNKVFLLDEKTLNPLKVAGCPPDAYSKDGQLWGNPIYDWNYLETTDYEWWVKRIEQSLKLYDVLRLDHFRGFESYYAIPFGDKHARNGEWLKGPKTKLFNAVEEKLGKVYMIAEDLGYLTEDTLKFKEELGLPGMKILQFAFSGDSKNPYLPHNYEKNCVVYTGTHDNNTIKGWLEKTGSKAEVENVKRYFNLTKEEGENFGIIRGAWSSVAYLSIALMQDVFNLGDESRMNMPSTVSNNWCWRAKKDAFTDEIAEKMFRITKMYGRCE